MEHEAGDPLKRNHFAELHERLDNQIAFRVCLHIMFLLSGQRLQHSEEA